MTTKPRRWWVFLVGLLCGMVLLAMIQVVVYECMVAQNRRAIEQEQLSDE